jgi:hypothetical protein|tara:strand:- start:87 stop:341 length:255 start_codon:yes stop_codon:yes gene_type:complete
MKMTPQHDLSWFIKWIAATILLINLVVRSVDVEGDLRVLDLSLNLAGVTGWLFVGFLWHDRALIVLNAVAAMMLTLTLVNTLIS